MTFWDQLGIEATQDIKNIKRAYSQKLRGIDRNSDIEGFQRLHEAYQAALRAAENPGEIRDEALALISNSKEERIDGPLELALEKFLTQLQSAETREEFQEAYQSLPLQFTLGRDLLRHHQMGRFLHELHEAFKARPELAEPELLESVLNDLGLEEDVTLYAEYETEINDLWNIARYQQQKYLWLQKIDDKTAAILLDPSIQAGYSDRRERKVLVNIMEAITLIQTHYPLLQGRLVSFEKIKFWEDLDRSGLVTFDHLLWAFWGFLLVPALKAAVFFHPLTEGVNDFILLICYPLGLLSVLATRKLQHMTRDAHSEDSWISRAMAIRARGPVLLTVLVLNLLWAAIAILAKLYASTHAIAVLGLFSLFIVVPMPLVLVGFGTAIGFLLLAILLPRDQTIDLALAAQLGTPLLFFVPRLSLVWDKLRKKMKPQVAKRTEQEKGSKKAGLNFFTIILAITLVRTLIWIVTHHF